MIFFGPLASGDLLEVAASDAWRRTEAIAVGLGDTAGAISQTEICHAHVRRHLLDLEKLRSSEEPEFRHGYRMLALQTVTLPLLSIDPDDFAITEDELEVYESTVVITVTFRYRTRPNSGLSSRARRCSRS